MDQFIEKHTLPKFTQFEIDYLSSSKLFPGESNGTLLQYSCLENPMEGGAW